MIDIQSQSDDRHISLTKVGVKDLQYPIRVLDKMSKYQQTTARINLFVNLPHNYKGTHMSRFIEICHRFRDDFSMPHFLEMLEALRRELDAEAAFGDMAFPYFIEKKAPVSGLASFMCYHCDYEGRKSADDSNFAVSVEVPVTTVCPCSKAISERGAHNQRGIVKVRVELGPFFWIEDLIVMVEKAASSPLYSLLKREDEKYVTEHAYDNPKFVEDVVRDVYQSLREDGRFGKFRVEAETFESIHNHNAYARADYSS
jgi:GTP cyclohydrolase I